MRLLRAVVLVVGLVGRAWSDGPVLERVEILGDPASAVRLHLSEPATPVVRTLSSEGDAPDRVYVDLIGTALGSDTPAVVAGAGSLLRVRSAQFDRTTTRVVLDLAYAMPFAVRPAGRTVLVEFGSRLLAPPREAPDPRGTLLAESAPLPTAPAPARSRGPELAATTRTPAPSPQPARKIAPPAPAAAPRPVAPAGPPAPVESPAAVASASAPPLLEVPRAPGPPRPGLPVVVLDAGHGGHDPGATGVGGVLEKDVVLQVTRRLAARLEARLPVRVVLTRTDDSFLPIDRRLAVPGEGTVLFLSLHANACSDPTARGIEIFYGGGGVRTVGGQGGSPRAALLGRCMDGALRARVGPVRGDARPADFGVLVRNPVPSALVEIGYLTHPAEAARTQDGPYQELLADALVDGVAQFLRVSAPPL